MNLNEAKKVVTNRCLIATDVDKTILAQIDDREDERLRFVGEVAPQLIHSAQLGINICFLTGNSMKEVSNRILLWLVEQLCAAGELHLLDRFHFFCNSGGVYAHFSIHDEKLNRLIQKEEHADVSPKEVLNALTTKDIKGELVIRPRFIDKNFISKTIIPDNDLEALADELAILGAEYFTALQQELSAYEALYDISLVSWNGQLTEPQVEKRVVQFGNDKSPTQGSVQITLKPVLSFRHGINEAIRTELFQQADDLRSRYIRILSERLDKRGLGHYSPRPGGRTSIDVTMEKLDKAYGLQYLIDHLNVQGHRRKGQLFGSNTIYLGNEVIVGGGNDYVVSRIPGILVMAANEDRDLVPFSANIYVPHTRFQGPDAASAFLSDFNKNAEELLTLCNQQGPDYKRDNATVEYKRRLFKNRIEEKLKQFDSFSSDELQIMHALVSLMCREDNDARQWITILVNELNDIMEKLAISRGAVPSALGDSYDES